MTTKKLPFDITSVTTEEVTDKVNVVALQNALNKHIDLGKYGQAVEQIFFVFIAVPKDNAVHKPVFKYHLDSKTLEIAYRMDYEAVLGSSKEQVLEMMMKEFLDSRKQFKKKPILEFDSKRFYEDVEQGFKRAEFGEKER